MEGWLSVHRHYGDTEKRVIQTEEAQFQGSRLQFLLVSRFRRKLRLWVQTLLLSRMLLDVASSGRLWLKQPTQPFRHFT